MADHRPTRIVGADGSGLASLQNPFPMQARQAYASTATITRSSDVTPYTSGDVVGNSISATAAIEFQNIAPSGGGDIIIVDTQLRIDLNAVPSGMTSFTLALYSVTPPSAIYDNVA